MGNKKEKQKEREEEKEEIKEINWKPIGQTENQVSK